MFIIVQCVLPIINSTPVTNMPRACKLVVISSRCPLDKEILNNINLALHVKIGFSVSVRLFVRRMTGCGRKTPKANDVIVRNIRK